MNNKELEKKVKQFTSELAYIKGYVCSVDVLIKLGYITEGDSTELWTPQSTHRKNVFLLSIVQGIHQMGSFRFIHYTRKILNN